MRNFYNELAKKRKLKGRKNAGLEDGVEDGAEDEDELVSIANPVSNISHLDSNEIPFAQTKPKDALEQFLMPQRVAESSMHISNSKTK